MDLLAEGVRGVIWLVAYSVAYCAARLFGRRRERYKEARNLVVPGVAILEALRTELEHFDDASRQPQSEVEHFFRLKTTLLSRLDQGRLEKASESIAELRVPCTQSWNKAVENVRRVEEKHSAQVTRVKGGRPSDIQKMHNEAPIYRQLIHDTIRYLEGALRSTRRHADRDIRRLLESVLRKKWG